MKTTELKKIALNLKEVNDKAIELGLATSMTDFTDDQIEKQLNTFDFDIKIDSENNVYYIAVCYNNVFLRAGIIFENKIVETLNNNDFIEITSQF